VTDICRAIKSEFSNKDIWCWTGYSYEDLKALPIMQYLDVLVDGKFEQDKKDLRLKWRGSSNQRVIDVQESLKSGEVVLYLVCF
jgi:anaerobic ribonucleoside-triphosphate reductase activating protein